MIRASGGKKDDSCFRGNNVDFFTISLFIIFLNFFMYQNSKNLVAKLKDKRQLALAVQHVIQSAQNG
jgi:hypothetical protein